MEEEFKTTRGLKSIDTNYPSQELKDQESNISPGEINYYGSFIIPIFTIILIIMCLVVAFYSSPEFEDSLIPPYLIAAAIILGLDLFMMITQSIVKKLSNSEAYDKSSNDSSRSKKLPKIMTIILLFGYLGLIFVGGLTFTVLNGEEITSKNNATLSVTFFSVYCFIVLRAMIEILSFIILKLLNVTKNLKSKEKKSKNEKNEENISDEKKGEEAATNADNTPTAKGLESFSGRNKENPAISYSRSEDTKTNQSTLPSLNSGRPKECKGVDISQIEEGKELSYEIEDSSSDYQESVSLYREAQNNQVEILSGVEGISPIHFRENPQFIQTFQAEQDLPPFNHFQPVDEQAMLNKTAFVAFSDNDSSSFSSLNNKSFAF